MKILFANTDKERCGVHQFGWNLFKVLNTKVYKFQPDIFHEKFANIEQFVKEAQKYSVAIINWHTSAMSWMTNEALKQVRDSGTKVILIPHDENVIFDQVDAIMYIDPSMDDALLPKGSYVIGRPLLKAQFFNKPYISDVPIIGFSGFAFTHKGIEKIIDIIKGEGENFACLVRLHLPPSEYGYNPSYITQIKQKFKNELPNCDVLLTQKFLTSEELIISISMNDVNIFPYEGNANKGVSSIIDAALAARRPFLISESGMFRHILPEDREKITIGKIKISDVLAPNYCDFLSKYLYKWSIEQNVLRFMKVIREISK